MDEILQNLNEESIQEKYGLSKGQQFLHPVPKTNDRAGQTVACYTERMFEMTSKENLVGFVDGTFKAHPTYIRQLFILHIKVSNHVSLSRGSHLTLTLVFGEL